MLLSNDCVIVPDLGGFMAHHVDARYVEEEHTFLPPLRTLGFNPQLKMNDSLLVQSYIEAYDISYPEALRRIQGEVAELRQHLETEGVFDLNDIGTLRLNGEGNIEFEPCEAGILTPELYGLGTFMMAPLKRKNANGLKAKTVNLKDEGTITIKMSWLRNMVAAAAAVVAFLIISTPISNSNVTTVTQQSAFIPFNNHQELDTKTTVGNEPVSTTKDVQSIAAEQAQDAQDKETETTLTEAANNQEQASDIQSPASQFCIVMASQVSKRNAEDFVSRLDKKGFKDAYILEKKFRRVVYGSYATAEEAQDTLKQLRSESSLFSESWVMEID